MIIVRSLVDIPGWECSKFGQAMGADGLSFNINKYRTIATTIDATTISRVYDVVARVLYVVHFVHALVLGDARVLLGSSETS